MLEVLEEPVSIKVAVSSQVEENTNSTPMALAGKRNFRITVIFVENLHFKIGSRTIESVLSWVVESHLVDFPWDLPLIGCREGLRSPESIEAKNTLVVILESQFVDEVEHSRRCRINFLSLEMWNHGKSIFLPVIVSDLNIAGHILQSDIYWRLRRICDIAICEVPVGTMLFIVPIDSHFHV